MRVLFVINSLGAGGTERSTAVLLPHLRRRGVDVRVATLRVATEGDEARVRADGFPVDVLNGPAWRQLRDLRRIVRTWRPDVVHTAIFDADVFGRVAAWHTGVPVISSLVSTPYEPVRFNDPRVRPLRLRVVQMIDAWTARHLTARLHAVSDGVARANARALRLAPEVISVVPRGRDWSSFGEVTDARSRSVRAALGLSDSARVLLAIGRQEFAKSQVSVVHAAEELQQEWPEIDVVIAGRDGHASRELRAAIDASPIRDRVHLLGHRDDVPDLLAASDVFVLPSLYEGTAGAALEALAMGRVVVASDLPGLEGVLEHERNALLIPSGDVGALAAAIRRALRDRPLVERLVAAGRDDVRRHYTIDGAADGMVALYEQAAGSSPRSRG